MFYFYVLDSYSYSPSVCNVGIINLYSHMKPFKLVG